MNRQGIHHEDTRITQVHFILFIVPGVDLCC